MFFPTPRSVRLAPLGYSPMLEPRLPSLALLLLETDTEANAGEAVAGVAVAAEGRTQDRTGLGPGAAPTNTVGIGIAKTGRVDNGIARWISSVSIRGPLPHIAVHVEKAPGVGRKSTNINCPI